MCRRLAAAATPSIRRGLQVALPIAAVWPLSLRAQSSARTTDTLPASVVQRGMDAYNRRDADAMAALYDTIVVHHNLADSTGSQRMTREEVRDGIRKWFHDAPDGTLTLVKRTTTGPFVVDVDDVVMGGKRFQHLDIFEVRHGKIVREWEK
jgi:hypothetical protein